MNISMLRPNVAIDPGLRLDDRTAGGLVDAMLDALDFDLEQIHARAVQHGRIAPLGNPKGQGRFAKQFSRELGKSLIGAPDLTFGTRKRFSMYFDLFDVQKDDNGSRWLFLMQFGILGEGVSKKIRTGQVPLLLFTHHALVRLVQRAGCCTPEDLIDVLRNTAPLALLAAWASEGSEHLPSGEQSGWLIPAHPIGRRLAEDTSELVYLVLRQGRHEGEDFKVPVVATVLDGSMIVDHSALNPILNMLDMPNPPREAWQAAFQMTVKATRMGRREKE